MEEVARPEEAGGGAEGAQEHGPAHALRQHRRLAIALPIYTKGLRQNVTLQNREYTSNLRKRDQIMYRLFN